jgi:excisionase family DNA binding protein
MAAGTRYPSGSIWNRPADDTSSQQRATRPQNVCKSIGIKSAIWLRVLRSVFVDRAAEILGVSRRTVYYRIRQGRLRTIRTRCGSQRVLLDSIEALLREREEGKAVTAPDLAGAYGCPFPATKNG